MKEEKEKCSYCGQEGHNISTCSAYLILITAG